LERISANGVIGSAKLGGNVGLLPTSSFSLGVPGSLKLSLGVPGSLGVNGVVGNLPVASALLRPSITISSTNEQPLLDQNSFDADAGRLSISCSSSSKSSVPKPKFEGRLHTDDFALPAERFDATLALAGRLSTTFDFFDTDDLLARVER
jgi:hypothetical protein